MDRDPELGLSRIAAADEVLIVRAVVQDQRRMQLQAILDSLIRECEQAEANGLRIWDWTLEVTERKKEKKDD
jgi:hypothetical protein